MLSLHREHTRRKWILYLIFIKKSKIITFKQINYKVYARTLNKEMKELKNSFETELNLCKSDNEKPLCIGGGAAVGV